MNVLEAAQQIQLLRHWALPLLSETREGSASTPELLEVIQTRDRLDRMVEIYPGIQFSLLSLDSKLERHCASLLYIPEREALEVEIFSPIGWHGVHRWNVVKSCLQNWTLQVNAANGSIHHPAEVFRAFYKVKEEFGREALDGFLNPGTHTWKPILKPAAVVLLVERVVQSRNG